MAEQLSFGLWDTPSTEPVKTNRRNSKPRKVKEPRRCLACSKTFPSIGPHNRICSNCKDQDMWRGPVEFSATISF